MAQNGAAPRYELKNLQAPQNGSNGNARSDMASERDQRDRAELMRLGKVPVLKRSYNFLSITGFTCTVLVTWEAALSTMNMGLENGGTAGMIYMFLFAWVGATCVYASLGELASMAPISAGQYFWVAMLAPKKCRRILSFLTGWMTVVAWQALDASSAFLSGTLIQALLVVRYPEYNMTGWRGTLMVYAVLLFSVTINTVARSLLPRLEGLILIIHVMGFFGVLIPLVVLSDKISTHDVWTQFNNGGDFPTTGLSTMVGVLMSLFMFTGVDGAIHMSEEVQHASVVVPNSIMTSMFLNGVFGFAIIIAFAYATLDVNAALESPPGQASFASLYIYQQGTGSTAGTLVLGAIAVFMQFWSNTANMASASRMLWAFCRDKAVPGWSFWVRLSSRTNLPYRCIALSVVVPALLVLINIGSGTALNDLLGVVTSGYYGSYLMAIGLLLYRRLTGSIRNSEQDFDESADDATRRWVWGPWHVPGIWGVLVNIIGCCYLIIALFWSFWPSELPVAPDNMNYNCVIFGGVIILATVYYLVYGHKEYVGPIVETSLDDGGVSDKQRASWVATGHARFG